MTRASRTRPSRPDNVKLRYQAKLSRMAFLSTTLSLGIAALSVHCLYYSAQSIPKLQKYEDRTKKAARWSNAAEKRLWDTRYTVGAGFAMVSTLSRLSFERIACLQIFLTQADSGFSVERLLLHPLCKRRIQRLGVHVGCLSLRGGAHCLEVHEVILGGRAQGPAHGRL